MKTTDPLQYYAQQGAITDPGSHTPLLEVLPSAISDLCQVVQGLLIHVFWAERYGVVLSKERRQKVNIRPVSGMLARIEESSAAALTIARPLEQRLVGNCRDFSVLLTSMLRHQGVPARARCGFGTYFLPDHFEDHWVCEYWDAGQGRWVLVDAQLDAFQQQELDIRFDSLDVPRDQFIVGGKAWQLCRSGQADPDTFGILNMHGMWFIRGDLVRDFLALNKVEVLPWDTWNDLISGEDELPDKQMQFFDHLAELTLAGTAGFPELRGLFQTDPRIQMQAGWSPE